MASLADRLHRQLETLTEQGLRRRLCPLVPGGGARVVRHGREYLNLASNDYLGLATDPELVTEFYHDLDETTLLERFAPGATAARLMTGEREVGRELEERLAGLYAPGRVLLFNSGYHANIGILPALAGRGDLVLADKLCHASLIDGLRLCRATVLRYPHLDDQRLERLLVTRAADHAQVFIVTESVFSMDGDVADLARLVELKNRYGAALYVDEAHAVGVRGQGGRGIACEQGVQEEIDLLVGTFGKAWGGQGAFLVASEPVREYLLNMARSFIFTTGLPPVILSWLCFVAARMDGLEERRVRVRELSGFLRRGCADAGLVTGGDSNIIPVMLGEPDRALRVAAGLREQGYWVNAIRPPTVPPNTARLRLSLTAAMEKEELTPLPALIARLAAA